MYCQNCGKEIDDKAEVCVNCGVRVSKKVIEVDENHTGYNVLGFFIPLIGLILYLIWSKEFPIRSKGIGKWTLIGFIARLVVVLVFGFIVPMIFYSSIIGGIPEIPGV